MARNEYQINWDDDFGNFLNSYTYFIYPIENVPFDPTGHIMEVRSYDNWTTYATGQRGGIYGYHIYHGDNNGYDQDPSGWESA